MLAIQCKSVPGRRGAKGTPVIANSDSEATQAVSQPSGWEIQPTQTTALLPDLPAPLLTRLSLPFLFQR